MKQFNYQLTVSKYNFYDFRVTKLSMVIDNEGNTLDSAICNSSDWGLPSPMVIKTSKTQPLPVRVEMRWITNIEGKCFELNAPLDQEKAEELWEKQEQNHPEDPFQQYIVGIAPYGGVAVWLCNNKRSVLLHWLHANESERTNEEQIFASPNPDMEVFTNSLLSLEKLESNMRQFKYRFFPLEEFFDGEKWKLFDNTNVYYNNIDLDTVEVKRHDGTFDYSGCDDMMRYHCQGKPQRITVRWHEDNSSYLAHFWLDDAYIMFFFDSMFNAFPEANADVLLRIDTRANRYEVAMTAEGLPVRTLAYSQFIVFREGEEICRSEYYSKKDGVWLWE